MKNKILDFIRMELLVDKQSVSYDQDLLTTGMIDSIGVMRLVSFLETEFAQSIPPQDVTLENFSNINAIVAYLESKED